MTTVPHMLVVEADDRYRDLYIRMLARCVPQATVQTVADGHAALLALRTSVAQLVVVSDSVGPLGPINLITLLRYHYPSMPIIMLSSDHFLERDAVQTGVQHFVPKPFTLRTFRMVVTSVLPNLPAVSATTTPH